VHSKFLLNGKTLTKPGPETKENVRYSSVHKRSPYTKDLVHFSERTSARTIIEGRKPSGFILTPVFVSTDWILGNCSCNHYVNERKPRKANNPSSKRRLNHSQQRGIQYRDSHEAHTLFIIIHVN